MPNIPVSNIKTLNLIHKAMLFGQLLFAAISFYFIYTSKLEDTAVEGSAAQILQVVAIAVSAAGFYIGAMLFKKKIVRIREMQGTVQEKFSEYRSAAIFQWALLESPALFNLVCFFLTGNYAFLILAGCLILLFAVLGPNRQKVILLLGLNEQEAAEL